MHGIYQPVVHDHSASHSDAMGCGRPFVKRPGAGLNVVLVDGVQQGVGSKAAHNDGISSSVEKSNVFLFISANAFVAVV